MAEYDAERVWDLRPVRAALRASSAGCTETRLLAQALADYLGDEVVVDGAVLAGRLLVADLVRGESGYSLVRLPPGLLGLPPARYFVLARQVPLLVADACPPELSQFAEDFRAAWGAS